MDSGPFDPGNGFTHDPVGEEEDHDEEIILDIEGVPRGHLLNSTTAFLANNDNQERSGMTRRSARQEADSDPIPYPQPANSFKSSLKLEFVGSTQLGVPELPAFRNNVAVYSEVYDYLVVAERCHLLLFTSNPVSRLLNPQPQLVIDTRPPVTTPEMRAGANWPMDPHGINSLNVFGLSDGIEILVACCDDGRVLLWNTKSLFEQMEKSPGDQIIRTPALVFQLRKSAWGVDLEGEKKLLAVSDNTHRVTIFFLGDYFTSGGRGDVPPPMESPKLEHNIPDVKFVRCSDCDPETFYLSCISISGQVSMWEFYFGDKLKKHQEQRAATTSIVGSPSPDSDSSSDFDEAEEDESIRFNKPPLSPVDYANKPFAYGKWLYLETFQQEGWTINTANSWDFKEVDSIFEATANKWVSEDILFKYIRAENKKVLMSQTPRFQDLLGMEDLNPFVRFTFHEIDTQFIQNRIHTQWSAMSQESAFSLPVCQRRDQIRQKYLDSSKTEEELINPPFKDLFYICTTKKSLYLCRAENMACNGARSNVFNWDSPYGSDEIYFDRINIVKVVPSLSLMIAVSQVGAVSLFRLTRYKGFYFMRQEYVFPNVEKYLFEGPRLRIIVGVAVGPIKTGETISAKFGYKRFKLQLIYLDGFVMTYELSTPPDHDISVDSYVM
jgi:CRT10